MRNTICNDAISFVSDSFGVEPWSLRFTDDEVNYIWHTPEGEKLGTAVCFPLLGVVPDNTYTLDGKDYKIGIHGFAQDCDFAVIEKKADSISYQISDTGQTFKQFPYHFTFTVRYSLDGAALKTEYRVKNLDKKEMYFSVGGHPRYSCPIGDGAFRDYYIEFEKPESVKNIVKSYGPISEIEKCFSADGKKIALDYRMFTKGCFCFSFSSWQSKILFLKNAKNGRGIRFNIAGVTHLQFWTMPDAPYLAIEPFYGSITSLPPQKNDGDWKARQSSLCLESGAEFVCLYTAELLR